MASGLDLKVERIRARVTATELAPVMGVSRQRVSQVEALIEVNPTLEGRYRRALLQLTQAPQKRPVAA